MSFICRFIATALGLALIAALVAAYSQHSMHNAAFAAGQPQAITPVLAALAGMCAAAILLVPVLYFIRRDFSTPLRTIIDFTRQVAAGNGRVRIEGKFPGDFAALNQSLERMVALRNEHIRQIEQAGAAADENMRSAETALAEARTSARRDAARRKGLVAAGRDLEKVAGAVKQAADALAFNAHETASGMSTQMEHVSATMQAMEEMALATSEVARSAAETSNLADEVGHKARDGSNIVNRSVEAIGNVGRMSQALKQTMGDLGTRAESIGAVMSVITEIADQTNLLALNAAIEAARAGDAGRGFAVVADEVRKLAEKTMQATSEVESAVRSIQGGIHTGIDSMEQAAAAMDGAQALASESGQALENIVELVDEAVERIRNIATAAEEQSSVSDHVFQAMKRVREVSEQTSHGVERSGQNLTNLTRQIEELGKLKGIFRLIGEGTAQKAVEDAAAHPALVAGDRKRSEDILRSLVTGAENLELVYMTDNRGVQTTSNIGIHDGHLTTDAAAFGKHWKERPWFSGVLKTGDTYVSPIYISTASGDWCLTISTPIMRGGELAGVLAADVKLFT